MLNETNVPGSLTADTVLSMLMLKLKMHGMNTLIDTNLTTNLSREQWEKLGQDKKMKLLMSLKN